MVVLEFLDLKITNNEFDVLQQTGVEYLVKTIGVVIGSTIKPIDTTSFLYLYDHVDALATIQNLNLFREYRFASVVKIIRSGHFGM